jgi:hypothetical protein
VSLQGLHTGVSSAATLLLAVITILQRAPASPRSSLLFCQLRVLAGVQYLAPAGRTTARCPALPGTTRVQRKAAVSARSSPCAFMHLGRWQRSACMRGTRCICCTRWVCYASASCTTAASSQLDLAIAGDTYKRPTRRARLRCTTTMKQPPEESIAT